MKRRLELAVLLPEVQDIADVCVKHLSTSLGLREGIDHIHAVAATDDAPAQLCVHYDDAAVSFAEIAAVARQIGVRLTEQYRHLNVQSDVALEPRRATALVRLVQRLKGVQAASVTASGEVRVDFDRHRTSEAELKRALSEFHLFDPADRKEAHDEHGDAGSRRELLAALGSGLLLGAGFLLATLTSLARGIPIAFYVGAYLLAGWFTIREALHSIRAGRFEIDFLMLIAAVGAAALGQWAEGALLLFLFSLGHSLEHYAMGRARRAIQALAKLAPKTALVRRGDEERELPVADLRPDDIVIVRPDQRVPADGVVLVGETTIDESPITGESVPVDKFALPDAGTAAHALPDAPPAAHRVYAGTINGSGAIEIRVTKLAAESTLARVVKMVSEAETQKSPTQRLTDRFQRLFVPAVLALVALLLFAWVVIDEPFGASFYRAMAVLVAASPCALAIATPSAVLSGVARAGRSGVLIKGGGPLENLGTVGAIAFDKTGTLTEGKPTVTDIVPARGVAELDLLKVAACIESLSSHPIARAVVDAARDRLGDDDPPRASEPRSITGYGVEAKVDGQAAHCGKAGLFEDVLNVTVPEAVQRAVDDLEANGRTTMIVRRGSTFLGTIGLLDKPRVGAGDIIRRLRDLGVRRLVMLSGDNQTVAKAVGETVGIGEVWGELLPEDKVDAIRKLRHQEGKVAMIGDGVNDAPAMAHSTVGVAMGARGSDVALETADVALMADDLRQVPFAVALSRRTSRIIKQNLWLSLGVVALLVPATIFGLGIGPAVAMHEGSTLVVVFNALRLLAFDYKATAEQ